MDCCKFLNHEKISIPPSVWGEEKELNSKKESKIVNIQSQSAPLPVPDFEKSTLFFVIISHLSNLFVILILFGSAMSPHHPPLLFLLTYLLLLSSPLLANDIHSIPLNEWPMVMSHDAATGYLHQTLANEEVYRWTITQDRGAGGQLDCGVRGFDWRPALKKSGELVMHHGFLIFFFVVVVVVVFCSFFFLSFFFSSSFVSPHLPSLLSF